MMSTLLSYKTLLADKQALSVSILDDISEECACMKEKTIDYIGVNISHAHAKLMTPTKAD